MRIYYVILAEQVCRRLGRLVGKRRDSLAVPEHMVMAFSFSEHAGSKRSVRISRPAMIRRYRNRMPRLTSDDVASLAPRYVRSRIIAIAVIAILLIMKRPVHTAHLNGSLPSLTVADRIERRPCGCTRWNVEVDDRGQWLVQGLRFELKFDAAPRRRFLPTSTAASVPRIVDGRLARAADVSSNQPSNQINDLNVTSAFLTVLCYKDSSLGRDWE
ncbi:hypothetical protein ALC57_03394 [Trachymyrmex cornetzi]|uniref:Uncharacterized protein n=1 Tax=Trachymyrmex cornetzi TaxID=471704 RepID=A0A195EGM8_9HYME|nr:hypothetical protein ALC57_03394 [Trachymyrmex cornetzi]